MERHSIAGAARALGMLVALAGCSGDGGGQDGGAEAGSCASLTCDGCCRAGQCFPGDTVTACGKGSGACQTCLPGYRCIDGRCVFASGDAGDCEATCPGCCLQPEGLCQPGALDELCGRGGQACVTCPPPSQCMQGVCVGGSASCADGACTGCCSADRCEPGNTPAACGAGGAPCVSCQLGQRCVGGGCTGGETCGPGTCRGCCSAAGSCLAGTLPSACGSGGVACKMCFPGEDCLGGQCSQAP